MYDNDTRQELVTKLHLGSFPIKDRDDKDEKKKNIDETGNQTTPDTEYIGISGQRDGTDPHDFISFNAGGFITLNFKSRDNNNDEHMHIAKVYYSHNNSPVEAFFGMATGVLKSIDDGNSDAPRKSQQEIKFYPSDNALDNSIDKINSYKNTKYSVFKHNKIDFLKDIAKDYSNSEFFNISDAYSKSDIGSNFFGYMFNSMSKTEQAFSNYKDLNPKFESEINRLLEFSDPKKTINFENSFIQLSKYKDRIPYYSENRPKPENDLQVKISNARSTYKDYINTMNEVYLSYNKQKAYREETYVGYLLSRLREKCSYFMDHPTDIKELKAKLQNHSVRSQIKYPLDPSTEKNFINTIKFFEVTSLESYRNYNQKDINKKVSEILSITAKICDLKIDSYIPAILSNYVYELVKRVIRSTRRTVAHRGISNDAPENTLPAFNAAHKRGYLFVEADVMFTKDNIPVVTHDLLINRTSNGQGSLKNSNYSDIQNYDFGYRSKWGQDTSFDKDIKNTYKNIPSNYVQLKNGDLVAKHDGYEVIEKINKTKTGEDKESLDVKIKIPTFIDFVKQCKANGQIIYLDLKSTITYTKGQIKMLIDILKNFNMLKQVVWISISVEHLKIVHELLPSAELGITSFPFRNSKLKQAKDFKESGAENVFLHIQSPFCSENAVRKCRENDIELQLWALGGDIDEVGLDPYISSITTNPQKAN